MAGVSAVPGAPLMAQADEMRGRAGGRPRVLVLTSHPIEGRDGADKELAASVLVGLDDVDFEWFGRFPGRRDERLPGRRIPMLSLRGHPTLLEQVQAIAHLVHRRRSVDIVHVVMTVGPRFPAFASLCRFLCRHVPVIHTVPGVADPDLLRRSEPLGRTVALSSHTADQFRSHGFRDVSVIAPSIAFDRWQQQPSAGNEIPVVLYSGHHDVSGGAEQTVEIAAEAYRIGARFHLRLAMRSRPGEDTLGQAERLLQRARALGLGDVSLAAGTSDMHRELAGCDIFLFPPLALRGKADVPLTVIEALAVGRPVITSQLPHFTDLEGAVTRIDSLDTTAAGAVLARILADLPGGGREAAERRSHAEKVFSPTAAARAYRRLYRLALAPAMASR